MMFGCSIISEIIKPETKSQPNSELESEECPIKPRNVLKTQNIKSLTLSDESIIESGIAKQGQSLGYTFKAKSGAKIDYNTTVVFT